MTNRIDRLEERGLVQRRPDPNDRRGVHVKLTAQGKQRGDAALADLLDRERELLAGLSAKQQDALSALLRQLVIPFEPAKQTDTRVGQP